MTVVNPDVIIIFDDDEDDDVGRTFDECIDSCDERRLRSHPSNQGANDLQDPSLFECKTYLRKHGMRVSGTKEECIQRIKEHERLRDGGGESFYPRSSFTINCTGDACRGDVVLFKQNMYNSQQNIIERRTIAGRILKESYGASTQQHTFSVEVLWSERSKKLNPLSILLVKGRNLYRYGTFRQPWKSEAERSEVLKEKHERGKAARYKRKLREIASGDNKGTKRHKLSHSGPSYDNSVYNQAVWFQNMEIKRSLQLRVNIHNDVNMNTAAHNQAVWFQNMELKRSLQLTYHSDPNSSIYPDHHLQEASLSLSHDRTLLPFGFADCSHRNSGQEGYNQAFSQPPDHHHQNSEPPVQSHRNGGQEGSNQAARPPDHQHQNSEPPVQSYCNSGQEGSNQAFSQPPDHHHQNSEPPVQSYCNSGQEGSNQAFSQTPDHHHQNSEPPVQRSTNETYKLRFLKSSFSINCTGDAREKDIVLFKQLVFVGGKKVEKKRTVAGRIVKVRKCESRDKHKFLIKVLWTTPSINRHRRSTLLVRSQSLYKFGTFRRPWKNEANRSRMSVGKHAAAKLKLKKRDFALNKNKGTKRQKVSHDGPSSSKQPTQIAKKKASKKKIATPVNGPSSSKQPSQIAKKKGLKKKSTSATPVNGPSSSKQPSQIAKKKGLKKKSTSATPVNGPSSSKQPSQIAKKKALKKKSASATPVNGPSSSKQPTQIAKKKAFKKKSASETPVNGPSSSKQPSQIAKKKAFKKKSASAVNGPSSSKQPTQIAKKKASKKKSTSATPVNRPSSSKQPTQIVKKKAFKKKNASATPVKETETCHKTNAVQLQKTKLKISKKTLHLDPNLNTNQNLSLSTNLNPLPTTTSDLKQNPNPNICENLNPDKHQNPNPNTGSNPNTGLDLNMNTHTNLNTRTHPSLNPHPKSWLYRDHQLRESSLSFPHDRTFMPNHPPIGSSSNQPHAWFQPNQPPFGLPGYGQWGPNHGFIQPSGYYDHNQLLVLLLTALWYQQRQ